MVPVLFVLALYALHLKCIIYSNYSIYCKHILHTLNYWYSLERWYVGQNFLKPVQFLSKWTVLKIPFILKTRLPLLCMFTNHKHFFIPVGCFILNVFFTFQICNWVFFFLVAIKWNYYFLMEHIYITFFCIFFYINYHKNI